MSYTLWHWGAMISTNQSTAPTDLDQLEWTVGEVADIEDILAKLSTLF